MSRTWAPRMIMRTIVFLVRIYIEAVNTQTLFNDSDDSVLATEAETTDPFVKYVLGDSVSDDIFAWTSLGINDTRDEYNSPEGWWTEEGAEVNPNFSMDMAGMGDIQIPTGSGSSTAAPAATEAA
ncbi:uncharacterized protein BDV17DRAFT_291897 [Aspergillus undulatus]|uniref:uncharacterized protein n=1 Tax=Aspergillus undulatus TaxID=1810928 RepID=UPI003CCE469B